jgi:hypothetical protein
MISRAIGSYERWVDRPCGVNWVTWAVVIILRSICYSKKVHERWCSKREHRSVPRSWSCTIAAEYASHRSPARKTYSHDCQLHIGLWNSQTKRKCMYSSGKLACVLRCEPNCCGFLNPSMMRVATIVSCTVWSTFAFKSRSVITSVCNVVITLSKSFVAYRQYERRKIEK